MNIQLRRQAWGAFDYHNETDFGNCIAKKRQEEGRNIPSYGKGERSYSASGFEADVSGHLNSKYSGSDKNTADENGFSFDSRADFGILDAVSGNESVHANPDMEVSGANSFSEEVGNASGNVSDVPKMETQHILTLVFPGI